MPRPFPRHGPGTRRRHSVLGFPVSPTDPGLRAGCRTPARPTTHAPGRPVNPTRGTPAPPPHGVAASLYLTAADLARELRVHVSTVYRLAEDPTMPQLRVGGVIRFPRERTLRWLRQREDPLADPKPRRSRARSLRTPGPKCLNHKALRQHQTANVPPNAPLKTARQPIVRHDPVAIGHGLMPHLKRAGRRSVLSLVRPRQP
jgi:excisionase family DNA binding protein